MCIRVGLLSFSFSSVVTLLYWCVAPGSAFRSATPLIFCLLARAPVCILSLYAWLHQGRAASLFSVEISILSVYLLSGSLRVFFPSISVVSGFMAPRSFLTHLLGPTVQALWYAFSVGVVVGILFAFVGVLVRPFSIIVLRRDANMHTQQRRARIARQVGDLRGDLL